MTESMRGHCELVPAVLHGTSAQGLSPIAAAYRRILSQDVSYTWNWCQLHAITQEVRNLMLEQLRRHCGTSSETYELHVQEGAQLVQKYMSIAYDVQLQWLITDVSARQAMQALDLRRTAEPNSRRWDGASQLADEASLHRARINAEQIDSLRRTLLAQPAQKVAEAHAALRAILGSSQLSPEVSRTPLAQRPSNVPHKPATPMTQQLKRKRHNDMSAENRASLAKDNAWEDEDALQGEPNARRASIAAIQATTVHDDTLMPARKAQKTSQKAVKTELLPQSTAKPQPVSIKKVMQASTPPCDVKVQPVMAATIASPAQDIKLILKRQGQPDFCCKVSMSTTLAKIMTAARKQFSISAGHQLHLHFKGQRLSAAESVGEASLHDLAVLEVLDSHTSSQHVAVLNHVAAYTTASSSMLLSTKGQAIDLTSSPPQQVVPKPPIPPPVPGQTEPLLCQEQRQVVDSILAGRNVFYTGSAGCGKSTVLKAFVPRLRDMGKTVRIVAPTGKAALDINGTTTWTYAGWTPMHMKRPLKDLVKAAHGKFVKKRLNDTNVLVIDEISMVENHLLARLNIIMKAARGNDRPFGGVQLVVTGDFCQLPPVKPFVFCMQCGMEQAKKIGPRGETLYRCPQHGDCNDDDKWAFRSKVWDECNFVHVNLSRIHRQSDQVFIGILQKLRIGKPLTNVDRQLLLDHPCDVKNAVKLFPTREEVRRINQMEFDRLRTAKRDYRCLDYFHWNQQHGNLREKGRRSPVDDSLEALREHRLDSLVEFKAGMLVVLLVNLDITTGLVNGSQGRVIGFEPYAEVKLPRAATREGDSVSSFSRGNNNKKFRLGRESPEPSLPAPLGDLRGEYALLREAQIKEFILQPRNQNKMWPIVEFDNGVRRTIYADCQVNELGDEKPYTLLARTQIPLLAAWAMTIHKSQGMTLNKVIVDLGRSFEEGQEYVALSRARSLDGLRVLGLGDNVKGGNPQVRLFLKEKFNIE